MKSVFSAVIFLAVVCALPEPSPGQDVVQPLGVTGAVGNSNYGLNALKSEERIKKRWDIKGRVVTLQGDPVPGAKVEAELLTPSKRESLKSDLGGNFETSFQFYATRGTLSSARLSTTKKGFLPAQEVIHWGTFDTSDEVRITLRPASRDENLLSQEDLDSILSQRLKTLGPSDGLSAKSEKDYSKGVEELLDHRDPSSAIEDFAKVTKRDAACSKCWAMLALAELDSGDWDGAMRDSLAGVSVAKNSPRSGGDEAMLLAGVLKSWQDDSPGALDYLETAVATSPTDALALQELGRVQLQVHKWSDAEANLTKAIAAGAGSDAQLLRVQALLGEYRTDEASAEMARYLGGRSIKKMPLRVHVLEEQVEYQKKLQSTKASVADPLGSFDAGSVPELEGLEPATSQEQLKSILNQVGENVARFFQNFRNTSSWEEIHEEKGGKNGVPKSKFDEKCQYICMIPDGPKRVSFKEYRADQAGGPHISRGLAAGFMLTSGFASALYVFDPTLQAESQFRYLGRQKFDGEETLVVAFAQLPMKTQSPGTFRSGQNSVATYEKGLAWIDAQSYQIIRLRTDLLAPLPEVGLDGLTTQIDYQEVQFQASAQRYWLPRQADVTLSWNNKTYHNEHRYSDFKLFNVNTHQEIGRPPQAAGDTVAEQ
ncbi:MAG TPA: hypothetical protein VFM21_10305 [Terriglobia bacterium]|nr:hypothetical protein [Terriglobia bacterium]